LHAYADRVIKGRPLIQDQLVSKKIVPAVHLCKVQGPGDREAEAIKSDGDQRQSGDAHGVWTPGEQEGEVKE